MLEPGAKSPADGLRSDPFRQLTQAGTGYWITVIALFAVLLLAAVTLITRQWQQGLGVTGLNNTAAWGLYITNFVFLIGASAGGILVASMIHAFGFKRFDPIGRIAELVALGSLVMAMAFISLDLGRPDRFLSLLYRGRPGSPLIWDFWIMMTYLAITAALGYLATRRDMVEAMERLPGRKRLYALLTLGYTDTSHKALKRDRKWLGMLAVTAIPAAILLHSITAWLLGLVKAQPGWHSPLLAPLFIVSAAVSGLSLVILVAVLLRILLKIDLDDSVLVSLGRILRWLIPVLGYLLFAELLTTVYANEPSRLHIFNDMIVGRFALVFWFNLIVGFVLPLLLLFLVRENWRVTGLAAALVVIGVYAERVLIVLPTQLNREFPQVSAQYVPTLTEWTLVAGVWALGALVFTLLAKVFPLVPVTDEEV